MSSMKIKKGDTVRVIAGKDKDKEGKVLAVNKKDGKVLVEGVNMLTKHTKPSMSNQNGGIVHQEGPIDISNVMYVHKGKATRIGFKMDGDTRVPEPVPRAPPPACCTSSARRVLPGGCRPSRRSVDVYKRQGSYGTLPWNAPPGSAARRFRCCARLYRASTRRPRPAGRAVRRDRE